MRKLFELNIMKSPVRLLIATLWVLRPGIGEPLPVCGALDQSNELNGKGVRVRGFLQGSPHHGYSLWASQEAAKDPCPNWPKHFLTAPAIIEIGESITGTRGGEEYRDLAIEMNHRYSSNDYSSMEVEAEGILETKWPLFIIRKQDGSYIGNGYGQNGGRAALLHIRSIKKVPPTQNR
jgi:hypothetical protein